MFRESETLCIEVVMHETEGAIRKEVCRCIDIASVFCA
jgi:hypothetical protein